MWNHQQQRQTCQSWRSVAAPSAALISRSFLARESSWVMWLQGWFFSHFTSQENDPQVNCSSLFTLEDVTPVPGEKSPTCHIYENISRRKTCCIEAAFSIHGFPLHPQQHGEKIITGLCEFSSLGQFSRPHRYHWKIGTSTMPVPAWRNNRHLFTAENGSKNTVHSSFLGWCLWWVWTLFYPQIFM